MRALKTLFAGLLAIAVIVGGLFVAALVALTGFTILMVRRFLGRRPSRRPTLPQGQMRPTSDTSEVIDVVAAEVSESR